MTSNHIDINALAEMVRHLHYFCVNAKPIAIFTHYKLLIQEQSDLYSLHANVIIIDAAIILIDDDAINGSHPTSHRARIQTAIYTTRVKFKNMYASKEKFKN